MNILDQARLREMEIRRIDGRTYVVFSPDEAELQKKFETSMASEDTTEKLMESLLRAIAKLEQDRRAGWNQLAAEIVNLLNLKNREDLPAVLSYSWVYGGVEIPENLVPIEKPD